MVLEMTPILSGAVDRLAFEFSFVPAPDGLLASVREDVDFTEPVTVKGLVKNMAGYMCLSASAAVTYTTACARCAAALSRSAPRKKFGTVQKAAPSGERAPTPGRWPRWGRRRTSPPRPWG